MLIITDSIKRNKLWYDLPDGIYYVLLFAITLGALFLPWPSKEPLFHIILLFTLLFLGQGLLNKRFGWWIKNYTIIGILKISKELVEIETEDGIESYSIKNLQQIYVEINYFQNYTPHHSGTYSGIGMIKIFLFSAEPIEFSYILYSKDQYEKLLVLKDKWKEMGKLREY